MEKLLDKLGDIGIDVGLKILYAGLILFIGSRLINFLIKITKKSRLFNRIDKSLASFLLSFIRITLYIVLFVTIASILGVPLTSIVTVLGSAGIAIGLALQGGLSNIAGGIIILFFKPFTVGDFIDTHVDSGTVKGISLFYTTLVTPDNKIISIPNGNLANQATVNYSKNDTRRLDIDVEVSYKNDINDVKKIINDILAKEKRLIKDQEVFVELTNYKDSSMTYTIRVWVNGADYFPVKFTILSEIKNEFDKNKISIPYPQLDVHIEK